MTGKRLAAFMVLLPLAAMAGETLFQTQIASGCRSIQMAKWRHPTKEVMAGRQVRLLKAELCREDKFPVFTVKFPFDPQGATDSYFNPLYVEMAAANGDWPFAFVDPEDNLVVTVIPSGRNTVRLEYEPWSK